MGLTGDSGPDRYIGQLGRAMSNNDFTTAFTVDQSPEAEGAPAEGAFRRPLLNTLGKVV
jgi:hypothetical protein